MAIDKNSNVFTFGFAIGMVIVFGVLLTLTNGFMKPYQKKNAEIKKMMDILGAIQVESTRDNAQEVFDQFITESYVVNFNGDRVEGKVKAFDVDIKKDFRNSSLKPEDKNYPLYKCEKDGKTVYIVPMVGKGLWGPIWGFVAIQDDFTTIYGANFDHKTETPGLGAEIKEAEFEDKFRGIWPNDEKEVRVINPDAKKYFEVLKGGSGITNASQVDGITGGTITSKGVEEMVDRTFRIYMNHFNKL